MRHYILILVFGILSTSLFSQTVQISGVINRYAAVNGLDTCLNALMVSDTSGFREGRSMLIIQMQGASINTSNSAAYGQITALNGAGLYEKALVDSVASGMVFLRHQLLNDYNFSGSVQIVDIPRFASALVTDTLRAKPWDGSTGGVLVLELSDTLSVSAPISVVGAGFRGGTGFLPGNNNCNFLIPVLQYYYESGNWRGALKGEGISAIIPGREAGRGPQGNGGGGGNDHNAGGGGGGHVGGGGKGGNNDEPSNLGCDGYYPGEGGYAIPNLVGRLLMGGGGGAGHANNNTNTGGGNGGGIIIIQAGYLKGDNIEILANGLSAQTTNGDGGGGGGAGGSIRLDLGGADSAPSLVLNGGSGGNTENNGANRCFGPGGGGAGGRALLNVAASVNTAGGVSGLITGSGNACNGSSSGAGAGQAGLSGAPGIFPESNTPIAIPGIVQQPQEEVLCAGQNAVFSVEANAGPWLYQWQVDTGSGWQNIGLGPFYLGSQTSTLTALNVTQAFDGYRYRVVIKKPDCQEIFSAPALLVVFANPAASFTADINGLNVSFDNQSTGAAWYLWDFGDGQSATDQQAQHVYAEEGTYTVVLYAYSLCDTAIYSQEVTIFLAPQAGFSIPDTIYGCTEAELLIVNNSSDNTDTFAWSFPGGLPGSSTLAAPVVTYQTAGTYPVQLIAGNSAGQDTLSRTVSVVIYDLPQAGFTFTPPNNGLVSFQHQSQFGTGVIWDFGDNSPESNQDTVLHQYTASGVYTVTLTAINPCGASVIQQDITVTITGVHTAARDAGFRIYPNPADAELMVEMPGQPLALRSLRLFDVSGKIVWAQHRDFTRQNKIFMSELPGGVYFLQIVTENAVFSDIITKQ